MNVLFIYSVKDAIVADKPLRQQDEIQYGISYISSYLKKHGHTTGLLVMSKKAPLQWIDCYVENNHPAVICFTAVFSEYDFMCGIAAYVKERYPDICLVVGGAHVSINPESCLSGPFDIVCVGEGEAAILELVEQGVDLCNASGIQNLWFKRPDGSVEKNAPREFIHDLDALPYPDRDMWQRWIANAASFYSLLIGRGCPFPCTYCSNHVLRTVASGTYVRYRSPENIIAELRRVREEHPHLASVYFEIETFGVDEQWALSVCAALKTFNESCAEPLSFGTNLRLTRNSNLERLLAAMHACNFRFINVGLESGSPRVREEILKRYYSNDDVFTAVSLAHTYDIEVTFKILLGLPGETENDFKETVALTRRCQPDHYGLSIFFPYPGTELYRVAKERGLLENALRTEHERQRAVLTLPEFPKPRIMFYYVWFEFLVYRGSKNIVAILNTVMSVFIRVHPQLQRCVQWFLKNPFLAFINRGIKRRMYGTLERF